MAIGFTNMIWVDPGIDDRGIDGITPSLPDDTGDGTGALRTDGVSPSVSSGPKFPWWIVIVATTMYIMESEARP